MRTPRCHFRKFPAIIQLNRFHISGKCLQKAAITAESKKATSLILSNFFYRLKNDIQLCPYIRSLVLRFSVPAAHRNVRTCFSRLSAQRPGSLPKDSSHVLSEPELGHEIQAAASRRSAGARTRGEGGAPPAGSLQFRLSERGLRSPSHEMTITLSLRKSVFIYIKFCNISFQRTMHCFLNKKIALHIFSRFYHLICLSRDVVVRHGESV